MRRRLSKVKALTNDNYRLLIFFDFIGKNIIKQRSPMQD